MTQRGRSEVIEQVTDENREKRVENALVLFISMEKADEANASIIDRAVDEIGKILDQLKIQTVVLNPFAHLFGELSSLSYAQDALKTLGEKLAGRGHLVTRIPFGWFNEIEMRAKGHPLSRIGRRIEQGNA